MNLNVVKSWNLKRFKKAIFIFFYMVAMQMQARSRKRNARGDEFNKVMKHVIT